MDTTHAPLKSPLRRPLLRAIVHRIALDRVSAAFAVLILVALVARLVTFDRYLPYNDHNDEPNMYLLAQQWRGLQTDPVISTWLVGYPPLYIWIDMGVQQAVDTFSTKPWRGLSDYLYALRLVAALTSVLTTLLVIAIGWQLGGKIAGWFAGLVWALAPTVIINGNFAIPDPFVYLTTAAALAMALRAWHKQAPAWTLGSILAVIAAIYLKYLMFYALIPWGVAVLLLLRKQPRRMLRWLIGELALGAVTGGWLVFGYGAFTLSNREAETFRSDGLQFMFNLARNENNWQVAILPVGMTLFAVVMVLAALAYLISRRQHWRTVSLWEPAVLLVYGIAGIIMASSISNVGDLLKMRHTLPVTVAVVAVWGMGVAQIAWTLGELVKRSSVRMIRLAPVAALLVIGLLAATPMTADTVAAARQFSLPDSRYLLWRWTDTNVPADGLILTNVTGDLERTWNRNWGGYDGVKTFQWWFTNDPTPLTPQQYYQRDITYFTMSDHDRQTVYNLPGIDAWLSKLTLLKTIRTSDQVTGPTVHFYRMLPPQTTVHASFGGQIALVGYDLNAQAFHPGDTLTVRPYWRIEKRPTTNYSMFAHLVPDGSQQQIAQHDGAPTVEARPTLTWDDPDELYMGDMNTLTIPASAAPGRYHLQIGLYDFNTGQRLTLPDGSDSLSIPITLYTGATTTF